MTGMGGSAGSCGHMGGVHGRMDTWMSERIDVMRKEGRQERVAGMDWKVPGVLFLARDFVLSSAWVFSFLPLLPT